MKYYCFHKSYDHNTNNCIELKDAIGRVIKNGCWVNTPETIGEVVKTRRSAPAIEKDPQEDFQVVIGAQGNKIKSLKKNKFIKIIVNTSHPSLEASQV